MNTADHIEGFCELLDTLGIRLTLSNSASFQAIIDRAGSDAQPFDLLPGDCQTVTVTCLKADLCKIYCDANGIPYSDGDSVYTSESKYLPGIGSYFMDEDGGRYRLKGRRPTPQRPFVKYICEYTGADDDE